VESAHENFRVRRCDFYYYLDDDTIHVNEPKSENSGIPQGYFVKRHRVKKNENEYYHWKDFNLQTEISFYGKVFRICDCDDFTKVNISLNRNFIKKMDSNSMNLKKFLI